MLSLPFAYHIWSCLLWNIIFSPFSFQIKRAITECRSKNRTSALNPNLFRGDLRKRRIFFLLFLNQKQLRVYLSLFFNQCLSFSEWINHLFRIFVSVSPPWFCLRVFVFLFFCFGGSFEESAWIYIIFFTSLLCFKKRMWKKRAWKSFHSYVFSHSRITGSTIIAPVSGLDFVRNLRSNQESKNYNKEVTWAQLISWNNYAYNYYNNITIIIINLCCSASNNSGCK